ncbi:major tail protein [Arthrobacter phage Vulpecula]|nr:major tail protein [Arthrobacter phage Vulpecula]
MSVDATNVLTGAPDQLTTGPILSAPRGAVLPSGLADPIAPEFKDSGYIGEDGLTLTPERSTEAIKDWSGAIVRQILTEFGTTLAWAHLETNEESLKNYFGDDNVTVEAATASEGKRIAAKLAATEMPRKSYLFKIKDGDARVLIVVPDGQVTETGEVSFVKSGAVLWPVTLTTYPDKDGVNVYVFLDDGQVLVAGVPVVTSATPAEAVAGDLVTIKGTRFGGATAVKFGAANASAFTVLDGETIVATVPAGAAGSAAIKVTNATGDSAAFAYTRGA